MADIKETKRGTTPMLKVNFNGLAEDKAVVRAEFIFKQKLKEDAEALVVKVYGGSAADEVILQDGAYYIGFTEAETRQFKADQSYFMDTRITYDDGSIPVTNIVELFSLPTLFEEVE